MMKESEHDDGWATNKTERGGWVPSADDARSMWSENVNAVFEEAIRVCAKTILEEDEQLVHGWPVVSINQWDCEQERLLLLTKKAYYRVKFDFRSMTVDRFDSSTLRNLKSIHKGQLADAGISLNGMLPSNLVPRYGLRFITDAGDAQHPFTKEQYHRTFCANLPASAPFDAGKALCLEITSMFAATRKAMSANDGFYVSDFEIERPNPEFGMVSFVYNVVNAGFWAKRNLSSFKKERGQDVADSCGPQHADL